MYSFLKMHVGAFWTFQIALLLLAIAVACFAAADLDDGKFSDCVLVAAGAITVIDAFIFASRAAVMAMGV